MGFSWQFFTKRGNKSLLMGYLILQTWNIYLWHKTLFKLCSVKLTTNGCAGWYIKRCLAFILLAMKFPATLSFLVSMLLGKYAHLLLCMEGPFQLRLFYDSMVLVLIISSCLRSSCFSSISSTWSSISSYLTIVDLHLMENRLMYFRS